MSSHNLTVRLLVVAGTTLVLLLSGCSDDSAPRSVLTVTQVNGNAPLSSDVVNWGADGVPGTGDEFVYEDRVAIVVRSDAHDFAIDTGAGLPFGYVFLERYTVTFESDEEIPGVEGNLGWAVPANNSFNGNLTVVTAGAKDHPPLSSLVTNGGEITATAHITLFGREQTSNEAIRVEAILPVHFANWVDPN